MLFKTYDFITVPLS